MVVLNLEIILEWQEATLILQEWQKGIGQFLLVACMAVMGNSKTCQHVDHVDKKILFRCLRIGMFPTNCHQTKSRSLMSKTSAFSLARDSVAAEGTTTEPSSSALLHTSAALGPSRYWIDLVIASGREAVLLRSRAANNPSISFDSL